MVEQHIQEAWTGENARWRQRLFIVGARKKLKVAKETPLSFSFFGHLLFWVAASFLTSYGLFSVLV